MRKEREGVRRKGIWLEGNGGAVPAEGGDWH